MTTSEITQGIVCKSSPYQENNALVTIYTLEFGKLTVLARGVQKLTSKNRSSLQTITLSTFELIPKTGLSTLIRGNIDNTYKYIKSHIESEIIANYLLEYIVRYIDNNEPDKEIYDFTVEILNKLNQGYSYLLIYHLINCFILKQNGILLEVDGCVVCHNTKVISFSIEDGGFVCVNHLGQHSMYQKEELQAIRYLWKATYKDIDKLHIKEDILKKISPMFEHYIEEYCGIHLKTKTFIKQII